MSFRYIGSKSRLVTAIAEHIGIHNIYDGRFVDAFCGTGVVAETASKLGWPIWVNDQLYCAGIMAAARITSRQEATFSKVGGYEGAIQYLNSLSPETGFIWREYSPASIKHVGIERRYFTEDNAGLIDSIRKQIDIWRKCDLINSSEERLLIADLLSATNRVANIAGTYGCFLSKWQNQSFERLSLVPRELLPNPINVCVTSENVFDLHVQPNDLVYLDPPYTKRQYASYYHILETIALFDQPIVSGVSGLRPWQSKASDFCYKKRALGALVNLVKGLNANRILLSYSEEGHVPKDDLISGLKQIGAVEFHELMSVGRYRPNKSASANGSTVPEYLFIITKESETLRRGKSSEYAKIV